MLLSIPIKYHINETDFENIDNSLSFVAPEIESYFIDRQKNIIQLDLAANADQNAVKIKVEKLLEKLRPLTDEDLTAVFYSNLKQECACQEDVFQQLLDRGDVFRHAPGFFSISGRMLQMIQILDREILKFAQKQAAEEVEDPISVSLSTLEESGFFQRTPHFAHFVSTINEDMENISKLSQQISNQGSGQDLKQYLNPPAHICRSAVCYNNYPRYRNKTFTTEETLCRTTVGKVFRNESKKVSALERMYEFTVRDIIYYGTPQYVQDKLQECQEWYKNLMEHLQLKGTIQSATDPFFCDHLKTLQFYQVTEQSKVEIRLYNPHSKNSVSIGSTNNHGTHFSKSYNIKFENGQYLTTGCTGFGYERFIFLILAQHGLPEKNWPIVLQKYFEK